MFWNLEGMFKPGGGEHPAGKAGNFTPLGKRGRLKPDGRPVGNETLEGKEMPEGKSVGKLKGQKLFERVGKPLAPVARLKLGKPPVLVPRRN
jgi:hypothetical protein